MQPCRAVVRRRGWFWLFVVGTAVFMSLEPSLFLVTVALGLSGVALFWLLLLARLLLSDAVAYALGRRGNAPDGDGPAAS